MYYWCEIIFLRKLKHDALREGKSEERLVKYEDLSREIKMVFYAKSNRI